MLNAIAAHVMTSPVIIPAAEKVNLKGGWSSFWSAVTSGFPKLTTFMTMIGVALLVFALIKWAWDRRRGGGMGQGSGPLWGALIIGAILAAPNLLFPLLLGLLDWVANIVVSLFTTASK